MYDSVVRCGEIVAHSAVSSIQHWVNVRVRYGEMVSGSGVGNGGTLHLIQHWVSGSGVGKHWHILLSHPTLGECQGQVWGNTGTFNCLIQHWVNVRVLALTN